MERIDRVPDGARPTPLVFVHGAWHGAWCWDEHFLDHFAGHGYAAHAFSLRGHGGSANPRSLRRTRLDHYVDDLAAVVDGLDAPPVLIGHSMGGLIVQRYLAGRTLPGAVLAASVPPGGPLGTTLRMAARHPAAFARAHLTLRLWPIVGTPALAREAFFADEMPVEESDRHFARLQDESYFAYADMLLFRHARPGRIDTPILVVGGEADRIFTPAEVRRTAAAYGTEAVMIPGAAHDLMLGPHWPEAAACILGWLAARGI
ncbi:MAG: lysophospholipase [Actinobacteria bacterium]|nr:lysophospholipase [Actinomycetota bacterium]